MCSYEGAATQHMCQPELEAMYIVLIGAANKTGLFGANWGRQHGMKASESASLRYEEGGRAANVLMRSQTRQVFIRQGRRVDVCFCGSVAESLGDSRGRKIGLDNQTFTS